MSKISTDELINLNVSDAVIESIAADSDVRIKLSDAGSIVFKDARITELRICGYEVLDEDEEVVFDMPDVEVLGDKIPDALKSMSEYEPHAVEFRPAEKNIVLVVNDSTDTYEIEIEFAEIYTRKAI